MRVLFDGFSIVTFHVWDAGEISKVDEYEMRAATHIASIHLWHTQTDLAAGVFAFCVYCTQRDMRYAAK